jgi:hypothetical protein
MSPIPPAISPISHAMRMQAQCRQGRYQCKHDAKPVQVSATAMHNRLGDGATDKPDQAHAK